MRKPMTRVRVSGSRTGKSRPKAKARRQPATGVAAAPRTNGSGTRTALQRPPGASPRTAQIARIEDTAPGAATRGKYVYCIIDSVEPLRFGSIGIGVSPTDVWTVHYRNLAAYAQRRGLSPADADGLTAHIFVVAWRRIDDVPTGEEALMWLYGVAFKEMRNYRRTYRRRTRLVARLAHRGSAGARRPVGHFCRCDPSSD